MTRRKFGVELEHGNNMLTYIQVGNQVKKDFPDWAKGVDNDGSGVEVKSPILCGEAGLKQMGEVMLLLQRLGGTVGDDDGFHVHHDAPEFIDNDEAEQRVVTLMQSWCNNQPLINTMLLDHRRHNEHLCSREGYPDTSCYKQVTQGHVDGVARLLAAKDMQGRKHPVKGLVQSCDRFMALNVRALHSFGTIEFRQHHGTWNYARAAAWVRFGQCFIDTVLQDDTPIAPYDSLTTFLRDVGLDKADADVLKVVSR